jgi:xylulokinase
MAHALGIDIGTTNAKVALVDDDGRMVASAGRPIATHLDGEIGEQDAEEMWSAVVGAIHDVVAAAPREVRDVVTIGVCSQYSSTVPVDRHGAPVAPVVMYLDTRGSDHCWELMATHERAFEVWVERHGIPPVGGGLSLAHMLHLQRDRPEVHERVAVYLEPMDFVNLRLTGRVAATQATQFTAQLCDNRVVGVVEYDDELVAMTGLDADRLPPLVEVDGVVGELRADVAVTLGLAAGIEVRAGMNDSHAGAYATGATASDHAGLMIGTTSVLLDAVDHMGVDLEHEVLSMPAPAPGEYLVWAENGIAGKALETALGGWFLVDDALADSAVGDPFVQLEAVLAASPPSANGALFLPWLAGSFSPSANRNQRGGFLNLSLDTRRVDLVRAVVEGTAHNLRWLLPLVEDYTGNRIEELVFGGGAARSPGWAQVIADVAGLPVRTLRDPGSAAARAVGFVALQRAGATDAPLDALVDTLGDFEPDASTADRYGEVQAQFEAAFEATRPIAEALNP